MDEIKKAYLELHFTVFFIRVYGNFRKINLIRRVAAGLVANVFTSLSFLFFLPMILKAIKKVNDLKFIRHLAFIGVLVAVHWVCFFWFYQVFQRVYCFDLFLDDYIFYFYFRTDNDKNQI